MNKILISTALTTLVMSCSTPTIETGKQKDATELAEVTKNKEIPKDTSVADMETKLDTTPRVIGIGGIFFKSANTSINDWYSENLGMAMTPYGSIFESRNANRPDETNYLSWGTFPETTSYFAPSEADFMINYRVQNMEGLVRKLKANGVTIVDSIVAYDYGKFIHILDADGNKIELWEPIDHILTELGGPTNK